MLLALLSAILFALTYVLLRRGQTRNVPDGGMLLTLVLTTVALSALVAVQALLGLHPPLNPQGVGVFILAGLFTTFLGRSFGFASMHRIGPARSTSYRVTSPAFTLVLAVLFLGERIGPGPLLGMAVAGAGLWLLTRAGAAESGPEDRAGILLGLASAVSFGAGHALRKVGVDLIPSPYLGAWIGALTAVTAQAIQLALRGQLRPALVGAFRPVEWNLLGAGVLSAGGILALYVAFFYAPVSLAAAVYSSEPLFSVLFTRWLLRDREARLSRPALLGIAATVAGVALILLT